MLLRIVIVTFSTLLATGAVAGQLTEGSKVRVKIAGELAHDGSVIPSPRSQSLVATFLTMEPDHIILAVGSAPASIRLPKAAVVDLAISRGRSRLKGAVIGAGIGGLVAVVWGSVALSKCRSEPGRILCGLDFLVPVGIAIPVGSVVGIAIGVPQWTTMSPTVFAPGAATAGDGVQIGATLRF